MARFFTVLLMVLGLFVLSFSTTAHACKKNCKLSTTKVEMPKSSKQGTADQHASTPQSALKLRTELAFKQAGILTNDSKLTQKAIQNSLPIDLKDELRNQTVISILTKDGSKISDWKKFTTKSVRMPNGQSMQIHYYKNVKTGKIDYKTQDYKVKGEVKP